MGPTWAVSDLFLYFLSHVNIWAPFDIKEAQSSASFFESVQLDISGKRKLNQFEIVCSQSEAPS